MPGGLDNINLLPYFLAAAAAVREVKKHIIEVFNCELNYYALTLNTIALLFIASNFRVLDQLRTSAGRTAHQVK